MYLQVKIFSIEVVRISGVGGNKDAVSSHSVLLPGFGISPVYQSAVILRATYYDTTCWISSRTMELGDTKVVV